MGEAARREMAMEQPAAQKDFESAVAKAVDERMAKFRDEMLAVMKPQTAGGLDLLGPVMEQLGMKIADLADQSNGRAIGHRVEPELLRQREESKKEMLRLIESAQARGALPEYKLKNKVQLDNSIIEPFYIDPATKATKETEIGFDGIPNEQMIPINSEAVAIYEAYRGWIGNLKRVVPEDRLGITASGVVVKNGAVQARREVRSAEDNGADGQSRRPAVRVSHLQRGMGTEKRVLGSIHAPVLIVGG